MTSALQPVWELTKSRNKFTAMHRRAPVPMLAQHISSVIGMITPDGIHSNATKLDEWLREWGVSDPRGNKRSADVFAGLTNAARGMPYSASSANRAWIEIPLHFIDVCWKLTRFIPGFAILSGQIVGHPDYLQILATSRSEIFRSLGESIEGEHKDYEDDSEYWEESWDDLYSIKVTQAAVRWAVAHELSHLLENKANLPAAYANYIRFLPPAYMRGVQTASHQKEMACDFLAVGHLMETRMAHEDIATEIIGSLVATLAMSWDGYFLDGSAPSETHPSPSMRFETLFWYWMHLGMARGKPTGLPFISDRNDRKSIALLPIFAGWTLGLYGEHRNGNEFQDQILGYLDIVETALG